MGPKTIVKFGNQQPTTIFDFSKIKFIDAPENKKQKSGPHYPK